MENNMTGSTVVWVDEDDRVMRIRYPNGDCVDWPGEADGLRVRGRVQVIRLSEPE
jgi:hypothetical protein